MAPHQGIECLLPSPVHAVHHPSKCLLSKCLLMQFGLRLPEEPQTQPWASSLLLFSAVRLLCFVLICAVGFSVFKLRSFFLCLADNTRRAVLNGSTWTSQFFFSWKNSRSFLRSIRHHSNCFVLCRMKYDQLISSLVFAMSPARNICSTKDFFQLSICLGRLSIWCNMLLPTIEYSSQMMKRIFFLEISFSFCFQIAKPTFSCRDSQNRVNYPPADVGHGNAGWNHKLKPRRFQRTIQFGCCRASDGTSLSAGFSLHKCAFERGIASCCSDWSCGCCLFFGQLTTRWQIVPWKQHLIFSWQRKELQKRFFGRVFLSVFRENLALVHTTSWT